MKRPVDYIMRLQSTSSRNEMEAILREAAVDGCINLFKGFQLAYNKRRVFNVKKVPLIEGSFSNEELNEPSIEFNWPEFVELVRKLESRELTGNAAKKALHEAAEVACIMEWNLFYRPILMKDMRCGASEKTINKVLKDLGGKATLFLIPVWSVQLADDAKKHPKKMVGKKALDPKLDGVRLTAVLDKDVGASRLYTRNGIENKNFLHINEALDKLLEQIETSIVLDGEIVSNNFQSLMTQVNRKDQINTEDAHYALFDFLPLSDFEAGKCPITQLTRQQVLGDLQQPLREVSDGKIYVIPKMIVDLDDEDGKKRMAKFYEETIEAGYEGIMVKDIEAPYECKRTRHWLKWKPVNSCDLKVIELEEGTGRNEGKLGAMVCEGVEDKKQIRVNVGSGLSDAQRDEFWSNQNDVVGELVEIEYDSVTQAENGEYWSLRFPRFKRFRSDGKGKI